MATANRIDWDSLSTGAAKQADAPEQSSGRINWDSMSKQVKQPEQQVPAEEEKSTLQQFKEFAQPGEEEIQRRRDTTTGYIGEAAGGLVRGAAGLEKLLAGAVETVYDAGRIIGRESYKAVTDTPEHAMEPWRQTDYFTKNIAQAEQELLSKVLPEERDDVGKIIGRVAEYAAPTAAITRGFISKGKSLLADPTKVSTNPIVKRFQESLMTAAKNPSASQKLEQGVSALTATVGQTLENEGASPTTQMIGEIVTGILSGSILNSKSAIKGAWESKFSKSARGKYSENLAAEYLAKVTDADPDFAKKLKRGIQLSKETGVDMNFAQLTDNPELKSALEALDSVEEGGRTALDDYLAKQTKQIKKFAPADIDIQDRGLSGMKAQRNQELAFLEQKAKQTVETLVDSIDNVAPTDRIDMGRAGQQMLDEARDAANTKVNQLYSQVGNPQIGSKSIKAALLDAKKSSLVDNAYMRELDSDLKQVLEANILGKQSSKQKIIGINRPAKIIPKQRSAENLTLDQTREIETLLKDRIRIANAAGERNKSRILNKILSGVFDEYANATGEAAENISKLRMAADESRRFHNVFNDGQNLLASKINVQGSNRITPEGFVRNYIKANSDTASAISEKAVEDFYQAMGDIPESKNWLANSFGSLLKEKFPNIESENPRRVMNFINQHSRFLNKAGINDKFKNIKTAVNEAKLANNNIVLDQAQFKKSVIGKALNSDDPQRYIKSAIGTNKINEVMKSIDSIPDKARREVVKRGVREMAWEAVLDKLPTTQRIGGEIALDTGSIRKALESERYRSSLNRVLGKEHTKNLDIILDTVDRIKRDSTRTAGIPIESIDQDLTEKLMTGLRAAAHGFVRPDLIAAQMAKRGFKTYTLKESKRILKEALENPKVAYKLMKMSKTEEGRAIVKHLFSPMITIGVTDNTEEGE